MSSLLASLESGVLRWDRLQLFPEQDPDDRALGDEHVRSISELLDARVDPDLVDQTRQLPAPLLDELQGADYFRLPLDPADGGRGLSMYNTFRVIERAAAHSTPVGQVLGLANGAGAGALLPVLPPGPLRDFVRQRVVDGTVSGWADTEPTGQNNRVPATTATPTSDGTGYLLRGEKVFTGNGPVADLVVVTATIATDPPQVGVCFVDTASTGFQIRSELEFMGSNGLPNAALSFSDVFVPRDRVHTSADGTDIRQSPVIASAGLVGRLYIAAAPALAIARMCLGWQRDFVGRRTIDGRHLGDYDAIQRLVALTAAEVYAADSVVRWSLLGGGPADRWYERLAAKNIVTMTAWRIVDRTMSLLAGEGYETTASKRRRGVPTVPLERAFRDARGLRIAGNVDFLLDYQAARLLLARRYQAADQRAEPVGDPVGDDADVLPANRAHVRALAEHFRRFDDACREAIRRQPDPAVLFDREQMLILLGRIASELFTMSTVLARSTRPAADDAGDGRHLADVYCVQARHRLADLWGRLDAGVEPDYAKISRDWLDADGFDLLSTPGGVR